MPGSMSGEMSRIAPVTMEALSLSRWTTDAAVSSGRNMRPDGDAASASASQKRFVALWPRSSASVRHHPIDLVDANPMRPELRGGIFREARERRLRARIRQDEWCAAMSGTRTDVNDGAARPPLLEVACECLCKQERSFYVSRHHLVPQFWSRGLEVAAREARRRRVDEAIDHTELCTTAYHNFRHRGHAVREVDGYERRLAPFAVDLVANLRATRFIPAGDEDASRARSRARDRYASSQSARPARDDNNFALQRAGSQRFGVRWR